ncbi:MAG: CmcJ/NvfI family oxidoreductase [Gammaproteobacteria bacterium]
MTSLAARPLAGVQARLNYLAESEHAPAYYLYETAPGYTPPPPAVARHTVTVHDLRPALATATLAAHGFTFLRDALPALDFLDDAAVRAAYYPRCCELVRRATGAARVLAFDHNVRDAALAATPGTGVREPVRFVHNDYTARSGPQRVRDLLGADSAATLAAGYRFINVWRPLRGPVTDQPLAVCDASSMAPGDFVATDLRYADRTGEIFTVRHNPAHRWYYLAGMQADEVLLLECFDSTARTGRYTAHSAFRHPAAAPDAPTRRSIEVRTIASFADA